MIVNQYGWAKGNKFYFLEYRESFMPGSIGEFVVKEDTVYDFNDSTSVRGAYGLRHCVDMTPSEQHARNVAADRNALLAMSWKISL